MIVLSSQFLQNLLGLTNLMFIFLGITTLFWVYFWVEMVETSGLTKAQIFDLFETQSNNDSKALIISESQPSLLSKDLA